MRTWIKSACVVLAWIILPVILIAAGTKGSAHLAQANTRTSSTENILTSTTSVVAAPVTATSHTTRYIVQDGDTLSGIATRFAVHGGWPALYAANRQVIGPDPNVVHAGTVLVLPGQMTPTRYTVEAGDTLAAIAAEFAVHGGWPASTRPTGKSSAPIRTSSTPGPCSRSRPRRRRHHPRRRRHHPSRVRRGDSSRARRSPPPGQPPGPIPGRRHGLPRPQACRHG